MTDDTPTPNRLVAARWLMPASTAAKARARRSMESGVPIPNICDGELSHALRSMGIPAAIHIERETL
ncbi:MAG: hypothetical protein AAGE83_00805 [Pseudomonadota bacterium]